MTPSSCLCNSNPALQVCAELMKVLLHITDSFALPEFTDLRLRSMTSLATTCPAHSAQYLTAQFYTPNYSIRQRLDILEVGRAKNILTTPTFMLCVLVHKGLVLCGFRVSHTHPCCHAPSSCPKRGEI